MLLILAAVALIAVALILWILNSYVPLKHKYKTPVNIILIAALLAWLAILISVGYFRSIRGPESYAVHCD